MSTPTTTLPTFDAVWACAAALLRGAILRASDVSVGRGKVIDWRTVKSGDELLAGADAFDQAQLFVALVGAEPAVAAVNGEADPPAAFEPPPPNVTAYMPSYNGGRRRSFDVDGFTVIVEPNEDDARQAEFTARLARLAQDL